MTVIYRTPKSIDEYRKEIVKYEQEYSDEDGCYVHILTYSKNGVIKILDSDIDVLSITNDNEMTLEVYTEDKLYNIPISEYKTGYILKTKTGGFKRGHWFMVIGCDCTPYHSFDQEGTSIKIIERRGIIHELK